MCLMVSKYNGVAWPLAPHTEQSGSGGAAVAVGGLRRMHTIQGDSGGLNFNRNTP